jgi:hypothetical protein
VILMTDGEETCDPNRENQNPGNPGAVEAGNAAAALLAGWDIGSIHWTARTHVIAMATGSGLLASANNIANRGGTGSAYTATNEAQLSQALSTIIAGSILPEICDNTDNNCNGCTDEGHQTFCNRNKQSRTVAQLTAGGNIGQCCGGARATCLQNFNSSISPANPTGDRWWLPCWNPATDNTNRETKWVCSNPGEVCDNADNNCELDIDPPDLATNVQDEGFNKCPNCPVPETCDGTDENCDGVVDNAPGNLNPFTVTAQCKACIPSAEICDGCDNDCDGDVDEGVNPIACGLPSPARCAGQQTCNALVEPGGYLPNHGMSPGSCLPGGGSFGTCNNNPGSETCNGIDDNCDGIIDNNPSGVGGNCVPTPGLPTQGECKPGTRVCQNGSIVCVGYVGPTTEICDGLDNDCDGLVDAADPDLAGLGNECGTAAGQCSKGTTACVGGVIVCTGGNQPQPEVCNGLDDDCNGATDDGALNDAPSNAACWPNPAGTCNPSAACTHQGLQWCPPAGGTCKGLGTLMTPCATGTLACAGSAGWKCQGGRGPVGEVCDGADNDCDGQTDEQLGSPIGDACGTDVGECKAGVNVCDNGSIICDGEIGPVAELCDNLDNDCDTVIDNGIVLGSTCASAFDTALYPGSRYQGVCKPGVTECEGAGNVVCTGGTGPSP